MLGFKKAQKQNYCGGKGYHLTLWLILIKRRKRIWKNTILFKLETTTTTAKLSDIYYPIMFSPITSYKTVPRVCKCCAKISRCICAYVNWHLRKSPRENVIDRRILLNVSSVFLSFVGLFVKRNMGRKELKCWCFKMAILTHFPLALSKMAQSKHRAQ